MPGGIYSDLSRNHLLEDPIYYRFADDDQHWVSTKDWTFSTKMNITALGPTVLKKKNLILEFEGLDTVADIVLDDQVIGNSSNMFVKQILVLPKDSIREGTVLSVQFKSPVGYAREKYLKSFHDKGYDVKPKCQNAGCNANQIRKIQSSFS